MEGRGIVGAMSGSLTARKLVGMSVLDLDAAEWLGGGGGERENCSEELTITSTVRSQLQLLI